jgi:alpha-glucosidase (family GH31 glycosyl hydrolase)
MFHYPTDDVHFEVNNTEHTFIVADAVKVTPVLQPNATNVESYFPNGEWVNLNDYKDVVSVTG